MAMEVIQQVARRGAAPVTRPEARVLLARSVCRGASDRHLARRLPGARDRVPEGAVGGRRRPAPFGPAECKIVELTMKNEISRAASGGRVHGCRPRSNRSEHREGNPHRLAASGQRCCAFRDLSPPKSVRPPRSPARLENDDLRPGARPTRPERDRRLPPLQSKATAKHARAFIMSTSSQLGRTRCHA